MHVHTSHRCYMCPSFMLCPWQWANEHPWCSLWHFYCHRTRCRLPCGMKTTTHTSFNHVPFFSSTSWHCVHQKWNLHLIQCCHCQSNMNGFTSSILCNSKFCCLWSNSRQKKTYHDRHPIDHFLPLAIEVFGCLDKQVDVFLHDCANAIWNFKGTKGPPPFVFVTFLWKKISITLQRMQASSILSWAVAVGLATFQIPPLQNAPPITTTNLLQAVDCWDKEILISSLC
jgi:hypothetical protein